MKKATAKISLFHFLLTVIRKKEALRHDYFSTLLRNFKLERSKQTSLDRNKFIVTLSGLCWLFQFICFTQVFKTAFNRRLKDFIRLRNFVLSPEQHTLKWFPDQYCQTFPS